MNEATEQTATMPKGNVQNAINRGGEKETIETFNLVILDGEELCEVVQVRVYMARKSDGASPKYASVWVYPKGGNVCVSGKGKASGGGYCKTSAAVDAAIANAGIVMGYRFAGSDMVEVMHAMHAIANACGYADNHIRTVV